MEYQRLYVTGDTHGEPGRFLYTDTAFERIAGKRDLLFIAGDFGYLWDNSIEEQITREIIAKKAYTTCFIDGNHENFELLESYPVSYWCGGKVHVIGTDSKGIPKLIHLMRGQVYEIPGVEKTIFTMGGASSIDYARRKEGISWWPQEMPSPAEYAEAEENLKKHDNRVDYILTHTGTERALERLFPGRRNPKEAALNGFLEYIHEKVTYTHHYFGHLHEDMDLNEKETLLWFQIRDMLTNETIE